MSDARLS